MANYNYLTRLKWKGVSPQAPSDWVGVSEEVPFVSQGIHAAKRRALEIAEANPIHGHDGEKVNWGSIFAVVQVKRAASKNWQSGSWVIVEGSEAKFTDWHS